MRILIIEDEQSSADRLRRMLEDEPMEQRKQSQACLGSAESRQRKTALELCSLATEGTQEGQITPPLTSCKWLRINDFRAMGAGDFWRVSVPLAAASGMHHFCPPSRSPRGEKKQGRAFCVCIRIVS